MEGDDCDLELPYYCTIKVHRLMCLELKKFTDRILRIFPAIELSRPRSSGLQAVCLLHVAVDKAKLLIQHCSESSKFHLAITGDKILLRCEKIRKNMEMCLTQIQDTVPSLLAAKIHGIINDLKTAEFCLESSENEAGAVIMAMLRGISASNLVKTLDVNALKLASLRLNITSHLAVLIEKRSIKKILERVHDSDPVKRKILECLFYILRKYGNSIWQRPAEALVESPADDSSLPEPPEEFKCPVSGRLLYEPVMIATGKTYERVWIEKWFSEGHDRCPITSARLHHLSLVPNTPIRALIVKWCADHKITIPDPLQPSKAPTTSTMSFSSTLMASFGSSMNDLNLPAVSSLSLCESLDEGIEKSGEGDASLEMLSGLASLPWKFQCEAVREMKDQLMENVEMCLVTGPADGSVKGLIRFMKEAHDSGDLEALRDGGEVLSVILDQNRCKASLLDDEDFHILVSFLDSEIIDKALVIVESLSSQESYKAQIVASGVLPSIIKILDTPVKKYQMVAFRTLSNLSSNPDIGHHMVYLDGISKLVSFLGDHMLAGQCIKMARNLCSIEEARAAIAEAKLSTSSIANLLEDGNNEEQEHTIHFLLSICRENAEYCELAMNENIIQSIVDLTVNGRPGVKASAMELLQLLGSVAERGAPETLDHPNADYDDGLCSNCRILEEKRSPGKAFRFLAKGRKKSALSELSR